MKKRVLFIVLIAAIFITIPVLAKSKTVGDRIPLWTGDAFTFDANTPFHVMHGWSEVNPPASGFDDINFILYIDGVQQDVDFVDRTPYRHESFRGVEFTVYFVTNSQSGLPAGDHVFRGEWWATCGAVEDWGGPPCADPDEWLLRHENEMIGTFQ